MREILFKGKRKDNGEWVEGDYSYSVTEDKHYIICDLEVYSMSEEENDLYATEWYEVIPESVFEFIGLTDKNNVKIFEGAIVKLFLDDGIELGVIRYSEISCRFVFYENNTTGYGFDNTCIFEIIGNIYDNPELLGEVING